MYQAIVVKFLAPTNHRGSRLVATAEAGRVIVPWDYAKDVTDNEIAAAKALASKYGWQGAWVGGRLPGAAGGAVFTSLRRERDGGFVCDDRAAFEVLEADCAGD